ncbi:MAG: rhodanese-like domain-containing protein, partial [Nitrospiraceae bacterium]
MLITTADLEKNLSNPELLLIDTRSYKEYFEGHIPGAVNLDLFAFHWIDTSKQGID